ncbi:YfhO family protein [Streptomyces sp. MUM 203J]|uniref:YfhO family protein n=1 Tax=Streptomyces sp. MUM 203J TaxID=2791990 RepID=UPI001F04C553|nr:YfhO family protein [Streptomyces sp. MUM 203J]
MFSSPTRGRVCGLAGLLNVFALCAGDAIARVFPFGPRNRAVNDLGNQFVPYHAYLWDLLHGRAGDGLLLNWRSGFGTSLLPDLGTYLTSPFALLVGLFPRDRIDLAVYVITVLKTGTAAALMTLLLLRHADGKAPGGRWAAAVLGASYGLCGWSAMEATYNPMWLDGLIGFPLLCLVVEWVREGRRPALGPLLVALVWTANFYTAYMATLGAALVLLARGGLRIRLWGRAAGTVLVGVGLAAPVLVPVFLGSRHAHPGWARPFAAADWTDLAARVMPATYSFYTPALFLGAGALLLLAALPFHRAVPVRERWLWGGLVAAVLVSLQWEPTHLVWHVFATPNGSPYRQTFVLAGLAVLAAWRAVAYGWPGRRALLGASGLLAALALGAAFSRYPTGASFALYGAGAAVTAGGLTLLRRGGGAGAPEPAGGGAPDRTGGGPERGAGTAGREAARAPGGGPAAEADAPAGAAGTGPPEPAGGRRARVLGLALLAGALVVQAAGTTAYADRKRLGALDDYPAWGAAHSARAAAVAAADGWPRHRTDPGRPELTGNDPLLVGGQGASYYSSHTPAVWTRTLTALGGGWTSRGRNLQSLDNPVTDALFGIGARWRDDRIVRNREALPLVTVRPERSPQWGRSAFRNQELLLGARVYDIPANGTCRVGTEVYAWAPDFLGTARLGAEGREAELRGGAPRRRAAMTLLGTQREAGTKVTWTGRGPVPQGSVGCLDRTRLAAAVAALRATAAREVHVSGTEVRAGLPPGTRGLAVLSTPRVPGWSCGDAPAEDYLGLVAAEVSGGSTVTCVFRPPGLRAGLAAGAVALLAWGLLGLARRSGGHGPATAPLPRQTVPAGPVIRPAAGNPSAPPHVKGAP